MKIEDLLVFVNIKEDTADTVILIRCCHFCE